MGTTSSLRVDDELYASAKLVGSASSRSAAQQIAHWALVGREIEASHHIASRDIAGVLAGRQNYDALTPREQAVVRAEWSERIDAMSEALDLRSEFEAEGRAFVECDEDGAVIEHRP